MKPDPRFFRCFTRSNRAFWCRLRGHETLPQTPSQTFLQARDAAGASGLKQTTFCRICEASCALDVSVDSGKVRGIEPRHGHRGTLGFACMKGLAQQEMYGSPDRLTTPLKRIDGVLVPVSWRTALQDIGAVVRAERKISPHRIGMYVGTAAGFSLLHPIFAQGFMDGVGSRNIYSSATQDCAHRFAAAQEIYGFPFTQPFPDLDNLEFLLVLGTNPVVSKWTFLQVAHPVKRLKAIRQRGGRVVVVDPRHTETAKVAGEHRAIQPGSDLYFLLSFLHELVKVYPPAETLDPALYEGIDLVAPLVTDWSPERTESMTGMPAADLRDLVTAFANADGAAIATGTGLGMGGQGTLAQWLVEVIIALSGNLDRAGGHLIGEGIFDFAAYAKRKGLFARDVRSRVGDFRRLNGAMPGGILADEILTPGMEQLTTLFVTGGNPLMTMPNAQRLRDALTELKLLVVTDIYLNETASLADYVLPATSPLERPDLPFVFPLFLGLQSIPYLAATEAVVEPPGATRDEATIYTQLASACGVGLFGSRLLQTPLAALIRLRQWFSEGRRGFPQRWLLDRILRHNGAPDFKTLLKHPDGYPLPATKAGSFLGKRVTTATGKVRLAPEEFVATLSAVARAVPADPDSSFRLISKRRHNTHNSWTQNVASLTRGPNEQTNAAYLHPEDLASLGISAGMAVDIRSQAGVIRLPAQPLDTLELGLVSVPHGWGHQHAEGLAIASKLQGANVNILASDGAAALEPLSGMAHLTGVPVSVAPAQGAINPHSWSGI